ncbi:MAG: fibronectin type III domain-containing protein [Candidatus Harrisonbacteria bacterium]|nr:fibronectin type III domain-containing protein [Candidatus Harrisonbacteria bacterium]
MIFPRTKTLLLTACIAAALVPFPAAARAYTPAEQALIAQLTERIELLKLQIQLLLLQRELQALQTKSAQGIYIEDRRPPKIFSVAGKVIYGDSPWLLPTASTTIVLKNDAFQLAHAVDIPRLVASTTYYYDIEAEDAAGNAIRYGQQGTTTLVRRVSQTPVISRIYIEATTTLAKMYWKTDSVTMGVVYYSTTYPIALDSPYAKTFTDPDYKTDHSIILADLTPNTTYYFLIQARDIYSNVTTSGDNMFRTR